MIFNYFRKRKEANDAKIREEAQALERQRESMRRVLESVKRKEANQTKLRDQLTSEVRRQDNIRASAAASSTGRSLGKAKLSHNDTTVGSPGHISYDSGSSYSSYSDSSSSSSYDSSSSSCDSGGGGCD